MHPKIGIITILKVNNYGAELQAFALQRKLTLLGYQTEIINYYFGINRKHIKKGEKLTVPISLKQRIKVFLLPKVEDLRTLFFYTKKKERERKFLTFHERYTQLSSKCYPSVNSLYETSMDYDIYCVGSDQVWNYQKGYSILPFFLDFVPNTKKKIAYSSSIGLSELSKEAISIFKEKLSGFDAISVRETQAAHLIGQILNREISTVLDPTLLLTPEEWREVADYKECPSKPFLLLYIVTLIPCRYATKLAEYIAREKGLQIVRIYRDAFCFCPSKNSINLLDASPADFIGLFDKASFVITNSFHGTVFSINFQKPFFSVVKRGKNTNSRLYSILNKLKLSDRIIEENNVFPDSDYLNNFTFENALKVLESERENSIDYLLKSIRN